MKLESIADHVHVMFFKNPFRGGAYFIMMIPCMIIIQTPVFLKCDYYTHGNTFDANKAETDLKF